MNSVGHGYLFKGISQSTEFSTPDFIYYIILEGKSKYDDRDISVFMLLDEQIEEWDGMKRGNILPAISSLVNTPLEIKMCYGHESHLIKYTF